MEVTNLLSHMTLVFLSLIKTFKPEFISVFSVFLEETVSLNKLLNIHFMLRCQKLAITA